MESDYLMSTLAKPMKSSQDLVEHMKSKGITFNIVSPEDAVQYMKKIITISVWRPTVRTIINDLIQSKIQ
ncbi:hypothetical protein HMPREF9124_2273 [Oribacterium sp. oral taxon 108 str. F0425]|nr:hypothetical protein HMPREF9124_2273 [Oribacterium sp. oral taxon 108 str. F0425]